MKSRVATAIAANVLGFLLSNSLSVSAADATTFTVKQLTMETALKAAQAAINKCRKDGFQTAVAVVDRAGIVQVVLRDRYAGAHTPDMAVAKAWTAAGFKQSTTSLAVETQPGKPMSGIRQLPRVVVAGGGLPDQHAARTAAAADPERR